MSDIENIKDIHATSTGNFTYKQYVFIPLDIDNTRFNFCGETFNSVDEIKKEIDAIIARKTNS